MPLNGLNKVDAKSRFTVSQLVSFVPLLFSVSLKLYFFFFDYISKLSLTWWFKSWS